MSYDEHLDDGAVTRELRGSLSGLAMRDRPSLDAITSRGRARRQRRVAGFAGLGITGVAAVSALALALTGSFSAPPAGHDRTIVTTAFTLTANAKDTYTLTLKQAFEPAELQHALESDGIPALVKLNEDCWSTPDHQPVSLGAFTYGLETHMEGGKEVMKETFAFNPAKLRAGDELFFGYTLHGGKVEFIYPNTINARSYSCTPRS